jgi:hypothetical protein
MPHGVRRQFRTTTLQQFQQLHTASGIFLVYLAGVFTESQFVKERCAVLAAQKIDTELGKGGVFLRNSWQVICIICIIFHSSLHLWEDPETGKWMDGLRFWNCVHVSMCRQRLASFVSYLWDTVDRNFYKN